MCEAHRLLHHSILGLRVIKKKKKSTARRGVFAAGTVCEAPVGRRNHKCFLFSPFYGRACRRAMLGSMKT